MSPFIIILILSTIISCSLFAGSLLSIFFKFNLKTLSYIQHVAAGMILAAAGVEILPDVLQRSDVFPTFIGFTLGIILMLIVREGSEKVSTNTLRFNWTFITAITVDITIDGFLIGITTLLVQKNGIQALLITLALTVELLSLGLTLNSVFAKTQLKRNSMIGIIFLISLTPILGGILGYFVGNAISVNWVAGILAFAVSVLLYLAAEELLKEAHKVEETVLGTTLFLGAFLLLLLLEMLTSQ